LKIFGFVTLLGILIWVTISFPFLWEISIASSIGGIWWFFFREPPSPED
jgi:hypothetical protein